MSFFFLFFHLHSLSSKQLVCLHCVVAVSSFVHIFLVNVLYTGIAVCVIIVENAGICYVHVHSKLLNILQSNRHKVKNFCYTVETHKNFSDSDLRSVH